MIGPSSFVVSQSLSLQQLRLLLTVISVLLPGEAASVRVVQNWNTLSVMTSRNYMQIPTVNN